MSDREHQPRSREEWHRFNARVLEEARTNDGSVEWFGDLVLIVLHTIGARTGTIREIPLFIVERDDEVLVYGTAEGAKRDPGWVHNLRAHPMIDVELRGETRRATFVGLPTDEAKQIVESHAATTPQLALYVESAAPRPIPVFRAEFDTR